MKFWHSILFIETLATRAKNNNNNMHARTCHAAQHRRSCPCPCPARAAARIDEPVIKYRTLILTKNQTESCQLQQEQGHLYARGAPGQKGRGRGRGWVTLYSHTSDTILKRIRFSVQSDIEKAWPTYAKSIKCVRQSLIFLRAVGKRLKIAPQQLAPGVPQCILMTPTMCMCVNKKECVGEWVCVWTDSVF